MSGGHLSKEFFELVKAIGESKSKQEEDRIILEEVGVLKRKMPEATVTRKKMKEFLVRVIYVEMLGHDASFGYIKAIELTASQNLIQKKVGYLCSALCLSPEHEFRFMLVNQLQRDLNSTNYLEACAALTGVAKLITRDMIPAIISEVSKLLKHERELVRKKAVMCMHRMHQLEPESVSHIGDEIRRTLCDKDPSVMGAALCLLHDLVREDPAAYKDLGPSFVSILKQITEHRLPREYDYHRMPAPWIQMRLLQILALLGRADQAASEGMYEVLMDVMRRADTGINVGYAVVYECVRTVTSIYPNATLLDAAAATISRFLSSDNHNLKYVGVTGLAAIVKNHPKYAADHQMAVIDCLEDPDETLKRKTLDLLYSVTNPVNVEFISSKLLSFLEQANDAFWRQDLVKRITQCAERFAPSNSWYVGVMARVFELAGELVKPEVAHNLLQLIAEGSGEDEEQDLELRRIAVETIVAMLEKPVILDQLMQIIAWALGEYGYLSETLTQPEIIAKLCEMASERQFKDPWTRGYLISAVMKLSAQTGQLPPQAAALIDLHAESVRADLQQRCREFQVLLKDVDTLVQVLPVDASCEDLEVDESLSFLDSYVDQALARGAVRYSPPADVDSDDDMATMAAPPSTALKLTPYARPERIPTSIPPAALSGGHSTSPPTSQSGPMQPGEPALPPAAALKLKPTNQVWGRPKPGAPAPSPAQAAAPQAGPLQTGPSAAPPAAQRASAAADKQADPFSKSVEQQAKEHMAAMLFGGVGGGAPTSAAAFTRPPGRASPAASARPVRPAPSETVAQRAPPPSPALPLAQAPAPAPAPAPVVDLLDMMSFPSGSPVQAPAKAPTPTAAPLQPLTPSAQPVAGVAGLTNGVGPVLGKSQPNGSAVPTTPKTAEQPALPPPAAPSPVASLDPFAGLSGGSPATAHPAAAPLISPAGGGYVYHGRTLQPLRISTPEFGARWMQCKCERKLPGVKTALRSPQDVVTLLENRLNMHRVEIIGQTLEGICAATLGGMGGDSCLIHCKVWPGRGAVNITIRTASQPITDSIAGYIPNIIV